MIKYWVNFGLLFFGIACASNNSVKFDDTELKAFISTAYPEGLSSGKTNVFVLHNTDCSCIDEELLIAEKFIQSNEDVAIIVILNSSKSDLYKNNNLKSNVRFIVVSPTVLFERGIIIATNKLLTYENGALTELVELKSMLK